MQIIAARRSSTVQSGSVPFSYLKEASVTFHREAGVEWDWMVDELREKEVSLDGLVLNGRSYDSHTGSGNLV